MKEVDFSSGNITMRIVQTAGPMLVAQVLSLLYSIVDRIYIGQIPETGVWALGGIGLCFPVVLLASGFANLFGMGGGPLCAIERGKKDLVQAEKYQNLSFTMLVCIGILLMLFGEIFARPLLIMLGASENSMVYALPYLRIYLAGNLFFTVSTGMMPFISAQGFPKIGMFAVVAGAVLNILLDPFFIFILGLGVNGAAIATVIAQFISFMIVCKFLYGPDAELKGRLLSPAVLWKEIRLIGEIVSLGVVAFIMSFSNCLVTIVANRMLLKFGGDFYITVMTIAVSIRQMLETPALSICEGSAPILSYNFGARNGDRVLKTFRVMFTMSVVYTALAWGLIEWKPEWFIGIFSADERILKEAVPLLHIYLFAFVFQSLQYTSQATFKALNKKGRAIFFSLFRKVIIILPLMLIMPYVNGLGVKGVFVAEPVSNFLGGSLVFLTLLFTLVPELKKLRN